MKISRLLIIISIAVTTFLVSCEDFEDTVVPSPTVSVEPNQVFFPTDNETGFLVEPTATSIDITISRADATGAIEVALTTIVNTDNSFTVPTSVSFAAGAVSSTITIGINHDNATPGKPLKVGISTGDNYYNPYSSDLPEYHAVVTVLDWQKYSVGEYYSAYGDATWTQDLYRAVGTDMYRFYDLYADGVNLSFTWEEGEKELSFDYPVDADGYHIWAPGISHPTYGVITVLWDSSPDWTFYDADADEFQLEGKWTVSAGSLGWLDDYFTVTELY